jgi:hypothetical protein
MIIKPLTNMDQRMKDRLWKEREMRAELSHEDRSWRNQQMMRDILNRRAIIQRSRLQRIAKEQRERGIQ